MGNPAEFANESPWSYPSTPTHSTPLTQSPTFNAGNTIVHNPFVTTLAPGAYAMTLPPGAFPHPGAAPRFNSYPGGMPIQGAGAMPLTQVNLAQKVTFRPS